MNFGIEMILLMLIALVDIIVLDLYNEPVRAA